MAISHNSIKGMPRKDWIEKTARFGYAAKGVVYCLIGALTAMAAFGLGGQKASKTDVFKTIIEQPFGKVLLAIVGAGVLAYSAWRFIQAIRDTEQKGSDAKGIAVRLGFVISGLIYLAMAYTAFAMVVPEIGGGGSGGGQQSMVAKLLNEPFGQLAVGVIALLITGKGVYQLYKAFSGSFMKNIHTSGEFREMFNRAGRIGYTARGIILGIIGYFFIRAALQSDAGEVHGTSEAFTFLENSMGAVLMGIVALGLVAYGVFMFVKARYRTVQV